MESKFFNKGDFVKYTSYNGSKEFKFGIFEGIDTSTTYSKKYSLALFYDSNKYYSKLDDERGWGYKPSMEVATKDNPCSKTTDTLQEDSWWKLCTDEEKEYALQLLEDYGYAWNEETMEIIDLKTGEILHKIVTPKIEYNGEVIKPMETVLRFKLKENVIKQNKKSSTSYYNNEYTYGYQGYRYNDWYD